MNNLRIPSLLTIIVCFLIVSGCILYVGSAPHALSAKADANAAEFVSPAEFAAATDDPVDTMPKAPPKATIIINEIHYDSHIKTDAAEYIELFNNSDSLIDLSGWEIGGAVSFTIPYAELAPGQYLLIAQDPDTARRLWNVPALGPYDGRLSTRGETITLRDLAATVVNEVTYQLGFPWPTVGEWPGNSIGLIHPELDNTLGGSWRSNAPSPAARNVQFSVDAPPQIEMVEHSPQQPTPNSSVTISARVRDPNNVESVELSYQIVEPGAYVSIADEGYYDGWSTIPMQSTRDVDSRGTLYRADLPADIQQHRRLIRYRVSAADSAGNSISTPYADDPQPNFAYFVYGEIPSWSGSVKPGVDPPVTYDFNTMNPLPVYHLLSQHDDVRAALFESQYVGGDYPWKGTLVYDGKVYDHIGYRARGGGWRYALGKNMVKFDFNRGHYFQGVDDFGVPYPYKWDKLNLSAAIQHPHVRTRGEHGLSETVGYKLFNMAGVAAPHTNYVHFRVIDDVAEVTDNQYEGDFMGLYLAVEQMDGIFLKTHELPDGNLYKMEKPTGYLNNQGENAVRDRSDLDAFQNGYRYLTNGPSKKWWRANLELENYYSFRSIVESIRHYDISEGKNFFFYLHPQNERWQIHPWDIDQTWSETTTGNGKEPFLEAKIFNHPELVRDYRNRLREIRDLLYNPEQVSLLLNHYADLIDTPAGVPSMVEADRMMWDHNPIMTSSFIDITKVLPGAYYRWSPTGDFRGMIPIMQDFMKLRSGWIDSVLLDDDKVPNQPTITYSGPSNYPADALQFTSSTISGPYSADAFSAMKWRITELNYPSLATYDATIPVRYEIDATWESETLSSFQSTISVPHGSCRPGRTCRARVRLKNSRGRWSHWSEPVEFIAGQPQQGITRALKISEIMYNPSNLGATPGDELEFIELKNVDTLRIDLGGAYFSTSIQYKFPDGASIGGLGTLILASNAERFQARYGFAPFGEYKGHLKNAGERIVLLDASDRLLLSMDYDNNSPWPELSDEGGYSIVLDTHATWITDLNDTSQWRKSTLPIGSPGADDPAEVVINEVLANPGIAQVQSIELWNPSRRPVKLSHWYLSDNPAEPKKYRFPANTEVPAGGFRVLRVSEFAGRGGEQSDREGFTLSSLGGEVYLFSATESGRLTGYQQRFVYGSSEPGYSFGRHVTSVGEVRYPPLNPTTLGAANGEPVNGPIVVTRLRYHGDIANEFIELTNVSSVPVNLYDAGNLADTWQLRGIFFDFPAGVTLQPNESLYLVPTNPTSFCNSDIVQARHQSQGSLPRVLGPYVTTLADNSGEFVLLRPGTKPQEGPRPYYPVDNVRYKNDVPWPNIAGNPDAILKRAAHSAYGDDPSSWVGSQPLHAAATQPATGPSANATEPNSRPIVKLCSFDIIPLVDLPSSYEEIGLGQSTIEWSMYSQQNVIGYNILGNTTDSVSTAVTLNSILIPVRQANPVQAAANAETVTTYQHLYVTTAGQSSNDDDNALGYDYYWLEAVGTDNISEVVAFTSLREQTRMIYLPTFDR